MFSFWWKGGWWCMAWLWIGRGRKRVMVTAWPDFFKATLFPFSLCSSYTLHSTSFNFHPPFFSFYRYDITFLFFYSFNTGVVGWVIQCSFSKKKEHTKTCFQLFPTAEKGKKQLVLFVGGFFPFFLATFLFYIKLFLHRRVVLNECCV